MTALDFTKRSTEDELMDAEHVPFEEFRACLVDLAKVNRLTLAYRPTLAFFDRLVAKRRLARPLEIVDVASGYGDMLRRLHRWARARGVEVSLTGIDLNPWSKRAAEAATPPSQAIRWITEDAFRYQHPRPVDVVISSQFTHHLADALVVKFLDWMEKTATLGWFVSDLHRHPVPYHFFRRFSDLARYHRFVRHDGPVSIARAFRTGDWQRLLGEAAIDGARVRWEVPFRLTVERLKERPEQEKG